MPTIILQSRSHCWTDEVWRGKACLALRMFRGGMVPFCLALRANCQLLVICAMVKYGYENYERSKHYVHTSGPVVMSDLDNAFLQ